MFELFVRPVPAALVTGCLIVLYGAAANAGGDVGPDLQQGRREISVTGSPDFLGPTGDTLNVSAGYGVYVRDRLLVRASFIYNTVEDIAPGENDFRAREADIASEYHFDIGLVLVPYVGGELGWRRSKWASDVESGAIYGLRAGLKYFIADNVAIDFAFSYKQSGSDVFISDFEMRDYYPSFHFGLRAVLGGR